MQGLNSACFSHYITLFSHLTSLVHHEDPAGKLIDAAGLQRQMFSLSVHETITDVQVRWWRELIVL